MNGTPRDESQTIQLIYDRQCPVCDYYCQRTEVDENAGELLRIDARVMSPMSSTK